MLEGDVGADASFKSLKVERRFEMSESGYVKGVGR
jgi:hypothetical protein